MCYSLYALALSSLFSHYIICLIVIFLLPPPRLLLLRYDGTLVGCAVFTFLSISEDHFEGADFSNRGLLINIVLSFTAGVIHSSCVEMNNLPALTLGFNLTTMALLLAIARGNSKVATLAWMVKAGTDAANDTPESPTSWGAMSLEFIVDAALRGIGQFCFVDTTLGGAFVLLGITINNRRAGYMALLGSLTAMVVTMFVIIVPTAAHSLVRSGIYGYNAVGTAVAMGGDIFFKPDIPNTFVAIMAAGLTVLTQICLQSILNTDGLGLPVLTFPFCLTAWFCMLSRSKYLIPIVESGHDLDEALDRRQDHTYQHRVIEIIDEEERIGV
jgi:urea transporter